MIVPPDRAIVDPVKETVAVAQSVRPSLRVPSGSALVFVWS